MLRCLILRAHYDIICHFWPNIHQKKIWALTSSLKSFSKTGSLTLTNKMKSIWLFNFFSFSCIKFFFFKVETEETQLGRKNCISIEIERLRSVSYCFRITLGCFPARPSQSSIFPWLPPITDGESLVQEAEYTTTNWKSYGFSFLFFTQFFSNINNLKNKTFASSLMQKFYGFRNI